MVCPATVLIFGNVQVAQPHFAIVNGCERIGQRGLSLAQTLDLGAQQRHSGLEQLHNRIVMPGLAIARDNLFAVPLAANRVGPAGLFGHSYRRTYSRNVTYDVNAAIDTPRSNRIGEM